MLQNRTDKEWYKIESAEHDRIYEGSRPFNFEDYIIDIKKVLYYEDYCYKINRRVDRGHRTKRLFELIDLSSLRNKKVLDVGCGNGQYSVFFAMHGAEVCGIDISQVGIDTAKKIAQINNVGNKCMFSVSSISQTNFQDNYFDIIIFHEVLHHAIKYSNVKEETLRILKPGGYCYCAESLYGNAFFQMGRKISMHGEDNKGDIVLKLEDLHKFAKGFSEEKIELMSLLFMSKRIFVKLLFLSPIRLFLFLLKKADDCLFTIFPSLKKYCGEAILILKK